MEENDETEHFETDLDDEEEEYLEELDFLFGLPRKPEPPYDHDTIIKRKRLKFYRTELPVDNLYTSHGNISSGITIRENFIQVYEEIEKPKITKEDLKLNVIGCSGPKPIMPSLRLDYSSREYDEPIRSRSKNWKLKSQRPILDEEIEVIPLELGKYRPPDEEPLLWSSSLQYLIRKKLLYRAVAVISETYCVIDIIGVGINGRVLPEGHASNRLMIIEALSLWNNEKYSMTLNGLKLRQILIDVSHLFKPGCRRELFQALIDRLFFIYTIYFPLDTEHAKQTVEHLEKPCLPMLPSIENVSQIITAISETKDHKIHDQFRLEQDLKITSQSRINGPTERRINLKERRRREEEDYERDRKAWFDIPKRLRGLLGASAKRATGRFLVITSYWLPTRPKSFFIRGYLQDCSKIVQNINVSVIQRICKIEINSTLWTETIRKNAVKKILPDVTLVGDPITGLLSMKSCDIVGPEQFLYRLPSCIDTTHNYYVKRRKIRDFVKFLNSNSPFHSDASTIEAPRQREKFAPVQKKDSVTLLGTISDNSYAVNVLSRMDIEQFSEKIIASQANIMQSHTNASNDSEHQNPRSSMSWSALSHATKPIPFSSRRSCRPRRDIGRGISLFCQARRLGLVHVIYQVFMVTPSINEDLIGAMEEWNKILDFGRAKENETDENNPWNKQSIIELKTKSASTDVSEKPSTAPENNRRPSNDVNEAFDRPSESERNDKMPNKTVTSISIKSSSNTSSSIMDNALIGLTDMLYTEEEEEEEEEEDYLDDDDEEEEADFTKLEVNADEILAGPDVFDLKNDFYDAYVPKFEIQIDVYVPHESIVEDQIIRAGTIHRMMLGKEDIYRLVEDKDSLFIALKVAFKSFYSESNENEIEEVHKLWGSISNEIMSQSRWVILPNEDLDALDKLDEQRMTDTGSEASGITSDEDDEEVMRISIDGAFDFDPSKAFQTDGQVEEEAGPRQSSGQNNIDGIVGTGANPRNGDEKNEEGLSNENTANGSRRVNSETVNDGKKRIIGSEVRNDSIIQSNQDEAFDRPILQSNDGIKTDMADMDRNPLLHDEARILDIESSNSNTDTPKKAQKESIIQSEPSSDAAAIPINDMESHDSSKNTTSTRMNALPPPSPVKASKKPMPVFTHMDSVIRNAIDVLPSDDNNELEEYMDDTAPGVDTIEENLDAFEEALAKKDLDEMIKSQKGPDEGIGEESKKVIEEIKKPPYDYISDINDRMLRNLRRAERILIMTSEIIEPPLPPQNKDLNKQQSGEEKPIMEKSKEGNGSEPLIGMVESEVDASAASDGHNHPIDLDKSSNRRDESVPMTDTNSNDSDYQQLYSVYLCWSCVIFQKVSIVPCTDTLEASPSLHLYLWQRGLELGVVGYDCNDSTPMVYFASPSVAVQQAQIRSFRLLSGVARAMTLSMILSTELEYYETELSSDERKLFGLKFVDEEINVTSLSNTYREGNTTFRNPKLSSLNEPKERKSASNVQAPSFQKRKVSQLDDMILLNNEIIETEETFGEDLDDIVETANTNDSFYDEENVSP